MIETQSVEEIMKRIREQLRTNAAAKPAPAEPATAFESSEKVLERIKQRLREPAPGAGVVAGPVDRTASSDQPPFTLVLHDTWQLRSEIQTALEGSRQTGRLNPRNPGLINDFIQVVKKVMKRSLTWYTRPLHLFQGGVIRALDQIRAIVDNHSDALRGVASGLAGHDALIRQSTRQISQQTATLAELEKKTIVIEQRVAETATAQQASLSALAAHSAEIADITDGLERLRSEQQACLSALAAHSAEIADITDGLERLRSELSQAGAELRECNMRGRVRDRDLRRAFASLESGDAPVKEQVYPATPAMFRSDIKSEREFDYFAFEELYRGEEADIRQRQQAYLQYFRGRTNVVDIGCGRGEFLELLRNDNISARGVELGLDQYLLCREKGLDVVQQDLFSFLEALPDESLGGLFSAQVIEHLTASDQLRYVALAYRKTMPGSPVIFETINAQCVYAVMRNFFLDPTHVRPVHPETLKFAMESMKFNNVELRFSGPVLDKQLPQLKLDGETPQLTEFNRAVAELNKLIYGDQDYAAIGWK